VRAILDGHIILSRALGAAGHYPAIDVLNSVSRLESRISPPEQRQAAARVRDALATYQRAEDLIQLGAYVSGTNPKLDLAIPARDELNQFLRQDAASKSGLDETLQRLGQIAEVLKA